ncbi:ABC transporter substrate-binding protein [Duganella sp. FT80W]|uniref:ABC transporter substrate-binding protein n=1 Tax=Duganella guangzhouensis TaxID=2666084 RepID=A0A6I2KYU7_9BURK|nr:ABC transporter substrate-binding protein [Duganella guangzhouensis]MRW90690.1 ABC transporter substrate-binding protein [Duganella guangzhouensis]
MSNPLDTLWYTRCPVPTGLGIAVQQGWLEQAFTAQSTTIRSLRESSDQAVRESHFDHTLQNSVRHGGNIPALWAKADGRDTRVIGLSWADETQRILVLPDSDIKTVRDLRGRRFGLPLWRRAQIDFSRAQALRGLENALKLDGLYVHDVTLFDYEIDAGQSDRPAEQLAGTHVFSGGRAQNPELLGLLRREVDAIFLKGAHAAQVAQQFGLRTIIDTGIHPDPLIRANNGTPRTLSVDTNLLDHHFDAAVTIVEQVLRAEEWAHQHPDETRRFLARETNSSEYFVAAAYGEDAHLKLRTDLSDSSIAGLQDFADFLHRWHFLPAPVDVRSWIDARPLQAVLAQARQAA